MIQVSQQFDLTENFWTAHDRDECTESLTFPFANSLKHCSPIRSLGQTRLARMLCCACLLARSLAYSGAHGENMKFDVTYLRMF